VTFTVEAMVRFEMAASGMVMLAWHLYCPPCDVCSELNLRVRLDILPETDGMASSISLSEVMKLPLGYCHSILGGLYTFIRTITLHVSSSVSPAVGVLALEMLISGGGRSGKKTISWYKCDAFNNFSSNQG